MLSRKECQRIKNEYAQFISKEQMREICHLSKRSCTLLLMNHAIPCTIFQKKTHTYIINRDDVIDFLKKNDPRKIRMMCRSFKLEGAHFILNDENRHYLREYYEEQLSYLPEILPIYILAQITGYSKGCVDKWCCDEVIESMTVSSKRYVQKDVFLDYLASDKYAGSIAVTKNPNKTAYIIGENFDPTGMVVTATYADGTTKTVTGYTIFNGNNLSSGAGSVTVSYSEGGVTKEAAVSISVGNPLTGISVTKAPAKTAYIVGESFNYTGMVVTATYANGGTQTVTGYSITNGYSLAAGQSSVTISYTENGITKTATTLISVSNPLVSIAVTKAPNKTQYSPGENFNSAGMVVTATYANGGTQTVVGYSVTDGGNLTAGKTSVTLSYSEGGTTKTCTTAITVLRPTPTLAAGNSWYYGKCTASSNTITSISLVDSYTPTGYETQSWDASAAQDRSVMCYRIGTELILAGNGSGYINANADSTSAFSGSTFGTTFLNTSFGSEGRAWATNTSLTQIKGLNLLKTDNVLNMTEMFSKLNLSSLDLSGFNTSNCQSFNSMFVNSGNLSSLDLSGFNTSSCQDCSYMFRACYRLTTIYANEKFNVSQAYNSVNMFDDCFSLRSPKKTYNSSATDKTYANTSNGYFTYKG